MIQHYIEKWNPKNDWESEKNEFMKTPEKENYDLNKPSTCLFNLEPKLVKSIWKVSNPRFCSKELEWETRNYGILIKVRVAS